ncbi:hypothetical protein Tco_1176312 [Tanacetum coccineum]
MGHNNRNNTLSSGRTAKSFDPIVTRTVSFMQENDPKDDPEKDSDWEAEYQANDPLVHFDEDSFFEMTCNDIGHIHADIPTLENSPQYVFCQSCFLNSTFIHKGEGGGEHGGDDFVEIPVVDVNLPNLVVGDLGNVLNAFDNGPNAVGEDVVVVAEVRANKVGEGVVAG